MPGHYDFGIYARCNFRAALGGKETTEIRTDVKFSEMSVLFTVDGSAVKPVVVTHNNEGERNPFGPTYCYGIPGLIVEVMETSGHIAALTLYEATL
ncbi:unnamed protein product, partial [Mesorhabditis belari]|uniref:Uncharacterized protein n=1 Tax=Mesorhabditis belari TaxID=2138241 RepID=A0AAF3FA65_9BILA